MQFINVTRYDSLNPERFLMSCISMAFSMNAIFFNYTVIHWFKNAETVKIATPLILTLGTLSLLLLSIAYPSRRYFWILVIRSL